MPSNELSRRRCDDVDRLVRAKLQELDPDFRGDGWTVMAVGGYGRRRLAPFSDVDLALIYSGVKPETIETLARRLFYPLWDAKLQLSHTVKSLREAISTARGDLHWLTACLDARYLGGDRVLFELFVAKLLKLAGKKSGGPFLSKLSTESHRRWRKYGHAGRLREPNIKDGKGGLRDIQAINWAAKALGCLSADGLIERGYLSAGEVNELKKAETLLWEVRQSLHDVAGRAVDVLSIEYREAVINRLFAGEQRPQWGRRFYGATRSVALIVDRLLNSTAGSVPRGPAENPDGLRLKESFFSELALGFDGLDRMERRSQSGRISELVPEWENIRGLSFLDPNHLYTVDAHSLFTVGELVEMAKHAGAKETDIRRPAGSPTGRVEKLSALDRRLIRQAYSEVGHGGWLLLAGLLHDIGKGQSDRHPEAGASIASGAAAGLGLDPHGQETVGFLVGHHLLLSHTATRRDLNDRRVIDGVAALVADAERLSMLYLLTIADALATGDNVWNSWKSALVGELFLKVLETLEGGEGNGHRGIVGLEERHFDLLDKGEIEVSFWPGENGLHELAVVAPDQPGLFSRIAGVLALNGLDVLAAQVYTTEAGRALEVFKIAGAFEPEISGETLERTGKEMIKAVSGRIALPYRMDELVRRYRKNRARPPVRVVIDNNASDQFTVIEVHAADEVGLLYRLTNALFELGLDIHLAKISTFGEEAVDVFYVSDLNGRKITDSEQLPEIEKNLLFRLGETA